MRASTLALLVTLLSVTSAINSPAVDLLESRGAAHASAASAESPPATDAAASAQLSWTEGLDEMNSLLATDSDAAAVAAADDNDLLARDDNAAAQAADLTEVDTAVREAYAMARENDGLKAELRATRAALATMLKSDAYRAELGMPALPADEDPASCSDVCATACKSTCAGAAGGDTVDDNMACLSQCNTNCASECIRTGQETKVSKSERERESVCVCGREAAVVRGRVGGRWGHTARVTWFVLSTESLPPLNAPRRTGTHARFPPHARHAPLAHTDHATRAHHTYTPHVDSSRTPSVHPTYTPPRAHHTYTPHVHTTRTHHTSTSSRTPSVHPTYTLNVSRLANTPLALSHPVLCMCSVGYPISFTNPYRLSIPSHTPTLMPY